MRRKRTVFAYLCIGLSFASGTAWAEDSLAAPVRLEAKGKFIDSGRAWGHSSPAMEDLDGDGLLDLLVGDYSGTFHVYQNIGTKNKPAFQDAGLLQAGDEPAKVNIYCCVGAQPRFLDIDRDGIRDFISSSYDPGHCYLFRGLPDRQFAKMVELVDRQGVPVRSSPRQQQSVQSFGSFFTPVDWDADGDADILIGTFEGFLKLRLNEGNQHDYSFAEDNVPVDAGGEPLKVGAHCCPAVGDWDGDGRWDIVCGADDGSVTWFRNVGESGKPTFEPGIVLVEKANHNGYGLLYWNDNEVRPGIRSQVEVTDFDDDGKLDLLLGDFFTSYVPKPNLDDSQKEELQKLIAGNEASIKPYVQKMEEIRADFKRRYPGDAIHSKAVDEEWKKAYQALRTGPEAKQMEADEAEFVKKMKPLLIATHGRGNQSHDLPMSHGFVWLYLRK